MTARTPRRVTNSHTDAYPAPRRGQSTNPPGARVLLMAPGQPLLGSEPCTQPDPRGSISRSSHLTASRCASEHRFSRGPGSGSSLKHISLRSTRLRLHLQIPARYSSWQPHRDKPGRFLGARTPPPSAPCPPRDEQASTGNETVKLKKE